jgi:hypothetical protein
MKLKRGYKIRNPKHEILNKFETPNSNDRNPIIFLNLRKQAFIIVFLFWILYLEHLDLFGI